MRDVERPLELGVLLRRGLAGEQRDRRGDDDRVPAPEVDARERVGEHAHPAQALDAVVAAGEDHAEREAEDHGVGVHRPDAAEVEVGRQVQLGPGELERRQEPDRSCRPRPRQRGERRSRAPPPCRTRTGSRRVLPRDPPAAAPAGASPHCTGNASAESGPSGAPGRMAEWALQEPPRRAGAGGPRRASKRVVTSEPAGRWIVFASRYARRPSGPSSRPTPDCLKPPKGAENSMPKPFTP